MSVSPTRRPPAPTAPKATPRGRAERCAAHQEVRGVQDTAAFKLLGEILHHLDDITTQLNGISEHLTQTAEEIAVLHSKVRSVEGKTADLGTVAQSLKTVADSNAKVLEELRKRVG